MKNPLSHRDRHESSLLSALHYGRASAISTMRAMRGRYGRAGRQAPEEPRVVGIGGLRPQRRRLRRRCPGVAAVVDQPAVARVDHPAGVLQQRLGIGWGGGDPPDAPLPSSLSGIRSIPAWTSKVLSPIAVRQWSTAERGDKWKRSSHLVGAAGGRSFAATPMPKAAARRPDRAIAAGPGESRAIRSRSSIR